MLYAFREDADDHGRYREWLRATLAAPEPVGLSDLVLSAVVRIATHPRIFTPATPLDRALAYVNALRSQPNAWAVTPGERHWDIFEQLCRVAGARGNLVADACFAALAIESGCEWITTDRDFSRFPGLRWRHPLTTQP